MRNKKLAFSNITSIFELRYALKSTLKLVDICLNPDVVSFVLVQRDQLWLISNLSAIHGTAIALEQSADCVALYESLAIEHKSLACFHTSKLSIRKDEITGFLSIGFEMSTPLNEKSAEIFKHISEIATNTIEKHLESQKLIDVFSDIIHKSIHDLKNPFTSISLTTEILRKKIKDPKTIEVVLDKLQSTNNRVFRSLEKLLNIFPTKKESFKLKLETVGVNDVLQEIKRDHFKNLPNSTDSLNLLTDKKILKEALSLIFTHLSIIEKEVTQIKMHTSESTNHIMILGTNARSGSSINNCLPSETNAFVIAQKLLEMLDGKVVSNYANDDSSYSLCIQLS